MAEGLLRHLAPERYEALSAGSHPVGFVHPLSVRVMAEIGIDISGHVSRDVREYLPPDPNRAFGRPGAGGRGGEPPTPDGPRAPPDVIVSLSDFARAHCPRFPARTGWIHWPILDPILALGTEDFRLSVFRGVREEIRALIETGLETDAFDRPGPRFGPEGDARV